jgi:hypothetical protein
LDFGAVGEDVGGGFGFGSRFAGAAAPSPGGDGEDPVYFVVLCFISRDLDYGKGIGTSVAVVPDMVRGSQMYVEAAKSVEIHRSPMYLFCSVFFDMVGVREKYITTPLMETISVVWELNVFVPAVAKSAHADQGPVKLVAVQ